MIKFIKNYAKSVNKNVDVVGGNIVTKVYNFFFKINFKFSFNKRNKLSF